MTSPSTAGRLAYASDEAIEGKRAVVAAQHPTSALAGLEVLAAGGNVVDAAVAAAFGAAVGDVGRTGIGGYGGHIVYHDAATRQTWLVDFPSRAPRGADPSLFAIAEGTTPAVDPRQTGPLAVIVPAVVAGLAAAHGRFGRLPWSTLLAPAIRAAEEGIDFPGPGREQVFEQYERARPDPETVRVFIDAWEGERLRQPDLARSLRRIAEDGPHALYEGDLAQHIVRHVRSLGGVLDTADLIEYQPSVCRATTVPYRGSEVHVPGENSGGGVLAGVLAELDRLDLPTMEPLGVVRIGALAETFGRVWRGRLAPVGSENQGRHTNHLSVADVDGNMVACTTTLQVLLGSAVTVPGTGIVLNSGMALFDALPGRLNSLAPGKPAITNMCPTVVVGDRRPRLSVGASGGRLIPSIVGQIVTLVVDHDWTVEQALAAPRLHTIGDGRLEFEDRLDNATVHALVARGYDLVGRPWGSLALGGQSPAVWFDDHGRLFGMPDPRRHGAAAAL
ncbi:MAG: gamma-glutamyltransferase family protein [Chloroflexi bacterium]|nr:gamma-glutamyltransferase family protein [Chloroflexota bacterium]